ncbi:KEOPS complex subunit Pcc1 [Pyrodictium occultum]|uniref:KEOPS complex subunit Pcc1 n=1 Tax=Pyrodictium occultum TaxID=2309 RepID=UPI000A97C72A|nr:KEOPS complex subunit Pcc1 [Pyrodictium occultum]
MEILLRIEGLGEEAARALQAAIRPDDATAPRWMRISERVEDGDLVLELAVEAGDPRRLGSLRNTVDEILEYLYSLLKAIEETTKTLKQPGAGHGGTRGSR